MKIEQIRQDFEVLNSGVVYFDNACMTLRPRQVVSAVNKYYKEFPACAGRSYHSMAKRVTDEVDKSRELVKKFINAKKACEVLFTKNTTEGINLVSQSFGNVLTTDKEHNSNLVPWLAKGVKHAVVDSMKDNTFDLEKFSSLVKGVELVSMVHTSNLDGYTIPAKEIIKIAHENGAKVMLDAAQSAPHKSIDVRKLDVDLLAFSGHKMLGPSGIGCLYGKEEVLNELAPFIVGGETVQDTTYDSFVMEGLPERFEGGLQNYAGIIGLGEAVKYLQNIGMDNIAKQENKLNTLITEETADIDGLSVIGPDVSLRGGIFNFNIARMDPHNIAVMLDESENIAVRSGAHCVHSWFNKHGMKGSARASLYFYNTEEECLKFVSALKRVSEFR